jgi:SpoVK/Ycf46/Vps4 family AAA+-type ATPase
MRTAVATTPEDVPLRVHLAELLLEAGLHDEAVGHLAAALSRQPTHAAARRLMARAVTADEPGEPGEPGAGTWRGAEPETTSEQRDYDWTRAEQEVTSTLPSQVLPALSADGGAPEADADGWDVEGPRVRLADVGGMTEVKARLEAAFLAPLRNADLAALYGKSLRGGLMLYGPPGCGKTFIARAVAGELGAAFLAVSLSDVLDMYVGQSERNLHDLFETARRAAPCVLFLDEIDALGMKRSQTRHSGMRGTVNQLLAELDGVHGRNEGVFALAATNHPWDVDSALRRPGRLDRTLLVLPPDKQARAAILRYHLRGRPVGAVDVDRLAGRTDGFSGADLAHLCDAAAETAMLAAARTGSLRMIETSDLQAALRDIRPSTGPWFEVARNVALFANEGGQYDELLAYLRRQRMV